MKIHKHTMISIGDIKPYENNARIHTTEQVAQIKQVLWLDKIIKDADI